MYHVQKLNYIILNIYFVLNVKFLFVYRDPQGITIHMNRPSRFLKQNLIIHHTFLKMVRYINFLLFVNTEFNVCSI